MGCLTGFADAYARVTGIDDSDPDHGAARFLAWLAEPHQHRWLIVLDSLDNPDDLTGLWPPTIRGGRTVVTTRRRDAALLAGRHLIDVDVFTPEQATTYLRSKLGDQPQRLIEADILAADLGYLPLALAQAVAYIRDRGSRMTCARYRTQLADQRRRLVDWAPDALPDQHRDNVAAAWSLSIDRANELHPVGLARPVLELAAILDPNGIPTAVFTTDAVAQYCTRRLGRLVDVDDLDDAVSILHRFSLAAVDETIGMVRVHGLLQRVIRDATDPAQQVLLAVTAANAVLKVWPPVERDVGHAQALRANTTVLRANSDTHLYTSNNGAHPLLFRATSSLGQVGMVSTAVTAYEQLLTNFLRVLGPAHPDTLTTRSNLAHWIGEAGDPARAVSTLQQLIGDRLRVLGPDHPDTLATRHSLAFWLGRGGDPAGGASTLQRLLGDQLRVLERDHPDTLATRHYLARWRGEAGDPAGAASALQQLLDERLRILGPDHPHTLMTRHNLARWQGEVGDPAGAVAAFQRLLDDRLRILGPEHPATLATRRNLADWQGEAGDPAGAASVLQRLLDDSLRVLGPNHYLTVFTRDGLAYWERKAETTH